MTIDMTQIPLREACRPDCCCPHCDSEMALVLSLDSEQTSKFMALKTGKMMAAKGKDPREIEAHMRWMRGELSTSQRAAAATSYASAGPRTACPEQPAANPTSNPWGMNDAELRAAVQTALNPPDAWAAGTATKEQVAPSEPRANFSQRGFPLNMPVSYEPFDSWNVNGTK